MEIPLLEKGYLIFLEGIDGCGKDTQKRILADRLRLQGVHVLTTEEPGGTKLGRTLRGLLLEDSDYLSLITELLLFNGDRAETVKSLYKPALAEGKCIIGGRSWFSSIAYQVFGRGMDLAMVQLICEYAMQGVSPDKVFWIDIPVEESRRRLREMDKGVDVFEKETIAFYNRVRAGYEWANAHYPGIITRIDGMQSPESITEDIWQQIVSLVNQPIAMQQKKIYFAASITGGRQDAPVYDQLLPFLQEHGKVFTEHCADLNLSAAGEAGDPTVIHDRDLAWLKQSDVVVAEVSTISHGVGYEIGRVAERNELGVNPKPMLLLWNKSVKKVSSMLTGSPNVVLRTYETMEEARQHIQEFFEKL